MKIKILLILLFASALFAPAASPVHAQPIMDNDGCDCSLCDCGSGACSSPAGGNDEQANRCLKYCCGDYELNDMVLLLVRISDFVLGIVGSLALLFIVYGGVLFLVSGGNQETVAKGKKAITGAVIGLILVFLSFTIINFVMTSLGYDQDQFGGEWYEIPN